MKSSKCTKLLYKDSLNILCIVELNFGGDEVSKDILEEFKQ